MMWGEAVWGDGRIHLFVEGGRVGRIMVFISQAAGDKRAVPGT